MSGDQVFTLLAGALGACTFLAAYVLGTVLADRRRDRDGDQ